MKKDRKIIENNINKLLLERPKAIPDNIEGTIIFSFEKYKNNITMGKKNETKNTGSLNVPIAL
tara:strand:- start:163 stop:351 length:189 start_codon:yes stop_codon:yes gene_type:complete